MGYDGKLGVKIVDPLILIENAEALTDIVQALNQDIT